MVSYFLSLYSEDCGSAPLHPNSSVKLIHHGHHEVGNGVVYGCKEGFEMRNFDGLLLAGGTSVVKCRADGTWEDVQVWCKGNIYLCLSHTSIGNYRYLKY